MEWINVSFLFIYLKENLVNLNFCFRYHLIFDPFDDVAILKHAIYRDTLVRPDRQKILNLKAKGGELK